MEALGLQYGLLGCLIIEHKAMVLHHLPGRRQSLTCPEEA